VGLTTIDVLRLSGVGKTFFPPGRAPLIAVDDLSFSLAPGEFVSVLGPSGCGKSTVLRLAAGLELPTSGDVRFRGEPITGPSRDRGVVFQAYNAFPWLTVKENIGFGLQEDDQAKRQKTIDHWLSLTGLADFADNYPKSLSGGMRQRLALARTLIVEPALLLLDEPFGALDEPVRRSMQRTLQTFASELDCAVVFVTHDVGEAIYLGDRVLLMSSRPGRIIKIFTVEQPKPRDPAFYAEDEFKTLYERIIDYFPNSLADA